LNDGLRRRCRPLLVGDAAVVERFVRRPGLGVRPILSLDDYRQTPGVVTILHVPHPEIRTLRLGRPQKVGGESAALAIRTAATLALAGRVGAVVTGPVSKESLHLARVPYPGHTELLAALSGVNDVDMLMAARRPDGRDHLRALLLTRHIPLMSVADRLKPAALAGSIRRVDAWLRGQIRGRRPRWALCGLNPHAGDGGLLGREEITRLTPLVKMLHSSRVTVAGPLPADVAWAKHVRGEFDVVACLYHDQGMIPLKALNPAGVVNVTVGLPWVRTSPGHGTAFDVAGGPQPHRRADPTATREAAHMALDLIS
jgi:4-hydroxythreonine-4-phosphate dehydrogenase